MATTNEETVAQFIMLKLNWFGGITLLMVICTGVPAVMANAFNNDKITVGGFGHIIGGYLNESNATFEGYGNNFSIDDESLIGMQIDVNLTDEWTVTSQLLADSDAMRQSGINWLYLTYKPSQDVRIKAGRLQTPILIHSDTRDVGFAYPWMRPPNQVYDSFTFRTFHGLSISKDFSISNQSFQLEAIAGDVNDEYPLVDLTFDVDVSNLWGLHLRAPMGRWTSRLAYIAGDLDLQVTPLLQAAEVFRQAGFNRNADTLLPKGNIEYFIGGLEYNDLRYFLLSEFIALRFSGSSIPDINSGYISGGITLNDWTYYATLSRSNISYEVPENEIPLGINDTLDQLSRFFVQTYEMRFDDSLDSVSVGARWDITNNIALKADITYLEGEANARSLFSFRNPAFDRQATLYSVGLFWIF